MENSQILYAPKNIRRISRRVLQENIEGWLFILPVVLSLLIFTAYPLYWSLILSFREWNPLGQDQFIGLANYKALLNDKLLFQSLQHVLVYALYTIPAGLIWGIGVALALQNIRWRAFFRALYFLPTVTSSIAISVVWSLIFQPDWGVLNNVLHFFGIQGPNWLGQTSTAMISVSIVAVWMGTGYWMVIFLAGLLDIPSDYLDAARVDGASSFQVFRYVTLPQLTPTIFYYLTSALISVWTMFDIVYVMTNGGPANSTMMPAVHLYNVAWTHLRMGYASAIAWVMAFFIFTFTAIHFGLSRRWVSYER
jgi:multiple sugar transport system permease protein